VLNSLAQQKISRWLASEKRRQIDRPRYGRGVACGCRTAIAGATSPVKNAFMAYNMHVEVIRVRSQWLGLGVGNRVRVRIGLGRGVGRGVRLEG
jgi:hypothetical protein